MSRKHAISAHCDHAAPRRPADADAQAGRTPSPPSCCPSSKQADVTSYAHGLTSATSRARSSPSSRRCAMPSTRCDDASALLVPCVRAPSSCHATPLTAPPLPPPRRRSTRRQRRTARRPSPTPTSWPAGRCSTTRGTSTASSRRRARRRRARRPPRTRGPSGWCRCQGTEAPEHVKNWREVSAWGCKPGVVWLYGIRICICGRSHVALPSIYSYPRPCAKSPRSTCSCQGNKTQPNSTE